MATAAQMLEAFGDIGYLQRGRNLLAKADPDLMRQIEAAVDAGDPMALRKLMAANIGLSDAPRARMPDMPYDMPPAKPSTDAVERRLVEQDLGPVGEVMPQPAVRTALDEIIGAGGGDELIARLAGMTPRPEYSLDIFNNPSVLNQDITDLFPPTASGVSEVMPGAALPSSGGGLIVQGGRGVPVGGPTGSGVTVPSPTSLSTQVTPRTGLPGRGPRRLETTAGVPQGAVEPRRATAADATQRPMPRLESPDTVAERRAMERLEDAVAADEAADRVRRFHRTNLREGVVAEMERARRVASDVVRATAVPAAAAATGIVAYNSLPGPSMPGASATPERASAVPNVTRPPRAYSPERPLVPDITRKPRPLTTADLAAETSPPPSVSTAPDPDITLDYAQMARDKIRQANEIQLREGRITPESAALSREADALYQRAADARREGFHPPIMPVEQQNEQTSAIRARQRRAVR